MKRKGYYDYGVDARDVDYRGKTTFTAFVHYILQAAGEDADLNGFGVRDLNCANSTWVLSRMAIEFGRWPKENESFTVRTWVNEVSRVMTTRNMVVIDADATQIAAAVTQWAIIDLDKRTALDIRTHLEYGDVVTDEPSPIGKPARIRKVEPQHTAKHKVVYSDIDFNRHMNSLRYLGLIFDMLPEEYFGQRELSRADINFIQEARFGQELTIIYEQAENSLFEITNEHGEVLCCASLSWL